MEKPLWSLVGAPIIYVLVMTMTPIGERSTENPVTLETRVETRSLTDEGLPEAILNATSTVGLSQPEGLGIKQYDSGKAKPSSTRVSVCVTSLGGVADVTLLQNEASQDSWIEINESHARNLLSTISDSSGLNMDLEKLEL